MMNLIIEKPSRFLMAPLTCGVALVLAHLTSPYMSGHGFEFFLGAIAFSSYVSGFEIGLIAAIISIISLAYFIIPPIHAFQVARADLFRLFLFGSAALAISWLSARLKMSQVELVQAHGDLEKRVKQRTEELSLAIQRLNEEINQRRRAESAILEISNREKDRLGQDLHDGLCQILAGIKFALESLREKIDTASSAYEDLDLIEKGISQALGQADSISRGLYPIELEDGGLIAVLEELARNTTRHLRTRCSFKSNSSVIKFEKSIALHVYRTAQEMVSNAVKGKARNIRIYLSTRRGVNLLSILDDGEGLGRKPLRSGMGLRMMENRAHALHGHFRIRSRRSGGTTARCYFPG